MQCMNCGSQEFDAMPNGAARCRYCGNMIQGVYRPAPSGFERQFNNMGENITTGRKDKMVAVLLAFFLGFIGIQFFYLNEKNKGIISLILGIIGLLTSFFIIGLFILLIPSIWALICMIQLLTMSDQEFNCKYNNFQFPYR